MVNKLTVGLQQKVGQPNYGSLGASCTVEVSLAEDDACDAQAVTSHIRAAFRQCRDRITEELSSAPGSDALMAEQTTSAAQTQRQPKSASEAQLRVLRLIAKKQGVDLAGVASERFNNGNLAELTMRQASQMIDLMKSNAVLGNAATTNA